jgi:hypothetical protein
LTISQQLVLLVNQLSHEQLQETASMNSKLLSVHTELCTQLHLQDAKINPLTSELQPAKVEIKQLTDWSSMESNYPHNFKDNLLN